MKNVHYFRLALLIVGIAALVVACSSKPEEVDQFKPAVPQSFILSDGLGRAIEFERPASSIISIAPSNTEILFAVGAGSQVIARDEFSDFPEAAKELPSVGGGFGALDLEAMVALQPDLVLASPLTPAEQVKALEKIGLKVYLLGNPLDIEGMLSNLAIVGTLTGNEVKAQEVIEELRSRVASIDEKINSTDQKPLVFYQLDSTDPNAPWTAGQGSFIDALIKRAGGENIAGNMSESYAQLSIEQLLLDNPEVIIVGDYTWGGVTAEAVMSRDSWTDMTAISQGNVYIFDDNLVSRPGPRLVDGLESMAKLLHPELFE